jgi:hypothetical protein
MSSFEAGRFQSPRALAAKDAAGKSAKNINFTMLLE